MTLTFFHGPMDCGKSTLALQIDHNQARQGRRGLLLVRHDRSGPARITSRLGLSRVAIEVTDRMDLRELVAARVAAGSRVDYVVVDEAQFLAPGQIDQLARAVDELDLDVYAFGITTDFRTRLFPGSQRLVELAIHSIADPAQLGELQQALRVVGSARHPAHASIFLTTSPLTSVRRKSRPWKR